MVGVGMGRMVRVSVSGRGVQDGSIFVKSVRGVGSSAQTLRSGVEVGETVGCIECLEVDKRF